MTRDHTFDPANELDPDGGVRVSPEYVVAAFDDQVVLLYHLNRGETLSLNLTAGTILELMDGELNSAGTTVVLVTHEAEIAAHARRRIYLRDGRIVADESSR